MDKTVWLLKSFIKSLTGHTWPPGLSLPTHVLRRSVTFTARYLNILSDFVGKIQSAPVGGADGCPVLNRLASQHQFWAHAPMEEESENKELLAESRSRYISFPGSFVPVSHHCRAPLANGSLCQRQDRHRVGGPDRQPDCRPGAGANGWAGGLTPGSEV